MDILKSIYKVLSSYWLAAIVLFFMTVVTLFGTLDQVDLGLWGAKKRYFHSWIAYYKPGAIAWPLPGGLLLMILLFINMVFGALVHVRKRWRGVPLLISHFGMLFLLLSGFVTWVATRDGYVALYPGQKSDRAESYRSWQLEVLEINDDDKATKAHVIPWEQLKSISADREQIFVSKDLPFDLTLNGFYRNAMPVPEAGPMAAEAQPDAPKADGFVLVREEVEKEEERNFPGTLVTVKPDEGETVEAIVWGGSAKYDPRGNSRAFAFDAGGKRWALQLVKESWDIAFAIQLDKFIFEKHPGTDKPKNYESRVTRLDSTEVDEGTRVAIRMNEPMRADGFVVFQESYGSTDPGPNPEYYSQFAVSDNPADQWPLYALIITGVGMFLHFIWKLGEYIVKAANRGGKKKSAAGEEAAAS